MAWVGPMSMVWTEAAVLAGPPLLVLALAVAVALLVDRLFGEPPAWAHPVVWMGRYLGLLGPRVWAWPAGPAWCGGALAWLGGAVFVMAAALALDVGLAVLAHGLAGQDAGEPGWSVAAARGVLLGLLLKPLLAWRMLRDEVLAVEQALSRSLSDGQQQLARLVSRDTRVLDEVAVRESAIESLAENLNDSVVAPLFWFAVAGLPGAALYRFANTADAMWGYKDHRRWMGQWAARADDVLSWLPARLTALSLCVAAGRWPGWRALRAEAARTPSPNGGWPMGAMALLLGVVLRKPGVYTLHAGGVAPEPAHTHRAAHWAGRATALAAAALLLTVAGMGAVHV